MISVLPSMEINRRFDVKRVLTHMSSATTDTIRWRHVSILVLFVLISGNLSFYHQLTAVYPLTLDNFSFIVSLGVLVAALILLSYCMFRLIMGARLAAVSLLLLTCSSAFFTDQFGIVIDYTMVDSFVQTDSREMQGLLSPSFLIRILLLGVVPAIIVLRLPTLKVSHLHEWRRSGFLMGSALLVVIVCLASFSPFYASFFRDHKAIRYYVNPVNPVFAISKYAVRKLEQPILTSVQPILLDALAAPNTSPKLVVMVVGETARSDRFSLNGYSRDTNPGLSAEPGIVSYPDVRSCGTSTAVSVPCMFSAVGKSDFNDRSILETENILDLLQRTGVNVLWRDNNSDSKGVALRVPFEDFRSEERNPVCDTECRDVGMLSGLQDYIERQKGDILIVLHQMGNHGPAYSERYPAEFEYFTPACHSKELSSCTKEEIDNAYDNAIRYTDFFLTKVISLLKDNRDVFDTTMLYVSDHGESLGEKGVYLHGMPYMIAPEAQTSVPVIVWEGSGHGGVGEDNDLSQALSHDDLFKSLLTTYGIQNVSAVEGRSFLSTRTDEPETRFASAEEYNED